MNRTRNRHELPRVRVPRASGDEPLRLSVLDVLVFVFPAPAGMNRTGGAFGNPLSCVPRASGDEPLAFCAYTVRFMCSPRQRG